MKKIIQFWKEFRYKKTFLFGCFVVFVYFYDWQKYNHGFYIQNDTNESIKIIKVVNDDREIVFPDTKSAIEPNKKSGGCANILSVSAYGGSYLKITFKREDNSLKKTFCKLIQPSGFKERFFGAKQFLIRYEGNENLNCSIERYIEDRSYCSDNFDQSGRDGLTIK